MPQRREAKLQIACTATRYSTSIASQLIKSHDNKKKKIIITKVGASYIDHVNDDTPEILHFTFVSTATGG